VAYTRDMRRRRLLAFGYPVCRTGGLHRTLRFRLGALAFAGVLSGGALAGIAACGSGSSPESDTSGGGEGGTRSGAGGDASSGGEGGAGGFPGDAGASDSAVPSPIRTTSP
jgi:hypothetical protein